MRSESARVYYTKNIINWQTKWWVLSAPMQNVSKTDTIHKAAQPILVHFSISLIIQILIMKNIWQFAQLIRLKFVLFIHKFE